jgi:hypothetical protein
VTRRKRSSRLVRRKEVQAVLMEVLRFMVEERGWFWWVGDGMGGFGRWNRDVGVAMLVV